MSHAFKSSATAGASAEVTARSSMGPALQGANIEFNRIPALA
jgi:hypothetical protein